MNKSFNSYIFKPSEKLESLEERRNLISWLILLFAILFFVLELIYPALIIIFGLTIGNLWLLGTRTNKYSKLNGSFPLKISIASNEIIIGEKIFPMNEIRVQKIICYDYRGRKELEYALMLRYLVKSNGIYNHIWFSHNGKEYRLRFRVDSKKHMEELEEIKKELGIKLKRPTTAPKKTWGGYSFEGGLFLVLSFILDSQLSALKAPRFLAADR